MAHTILYVDDNATNRLFARRVLVGMGYVLIEAEDAMVGLDIAASEVPDLILMDVNLPELEGTVATAQLKATPELCHIPVIAITADDTQSVRELCFKSGCDAYLGKPVSPTHLLETVKQFLPQDRITA